MLKKVKATPGERTQVNPKAAVPILLFVFVFGGTLGAGLPGGAGTRADYADYVVVPGADLPGGEGQVGAGLPRRP